VTYKCPYCNTSCHDDGKIEVQYYLTHEGVGVLHVLKDEEKIPDAVVVEISECPECGKTAVHVESYYKSKGFKFSFSYPPPGAKSIPEYIPEAIRDDYFEALAIVDASPKASATLSRRCLQGMIHDFWGIKEKNLNAEITSLKGRVPQAQWNAMDALRKMGNIGAHMEKDINFVIDVEPEEARNLIKLIELLIDKWYVARHDEENLLEEIVKSSSLKDDLRLFNTVDTDSK